MANHLQHHLLCVLVSNTYILFVCLREVSHAGIIAIAWPESIPFQSNGFCCRCVSLPLPCRWTNSSYSEKHWGSNDHKERKKKKAAMYIANLSVRIRHTWVHTLLLAGSLTEKLWLKFIWVYSLRENVWNSADGTFQTMCLRFVSHSRKISSGRRTRQMPRHTFPGAS